MLNPPDLSSFDLDDLSAGLLVLARRQHGCLRMADQLGDASDHPGVAAEVDNLDRDAATAAEAHRFVSAMRQFMRHEGHAPSGSLMRRALRALGGDRSHKGDV